MDLTRIEGRFKRGVLRELFRLIGGQRSWFDDPWEAVRHQADLWGVFTGLPPEHDHAPDVTQRGWMRLSPPTGRDATKTRWPTDPF
jgi:hypothetical protein